jgi:hypothetical protein
MFNSRVTAGEPLRFAGLCFCKAHNIPAPVSTIVGDKEEIHCRLAGELAIVKLLVPIGKHHN